MNQNEECASNDVLLVEYQLLGNFRIEWAKVGHNYGWVIIPICFTAPFLLYGYVMEKNVDRSIMI